MKKCIVIVVLFCVLSVLVSCKCKHEWSDATCDSPQICSKCGEKQGSALGHSFGGSFVEKEPTCSETGVSVKKCSACGKEERTELAKTSHTFSEDWTTTEDEHWHDATCVHTELTQDRGKHEWNDGEVTTDSTCIEDGVRTFTCKVCGYIKTENIPATGHTVDAGVIVNEPTCTENGLRVYSCTVCGQEIKTEPIPAAHNWNEQYSCDSCGKALHVEMIGPAGGFIFYDCDADNSTGNADGLTSDICGWRFLEAAPYDIEIDGCSSFAFGEYKEYMSGDSLYVNGTTIYDSSNCTRPEIGAGYSNTKMLVEAMGDFAYDGLYKKKIEDYPAKLCLGYEYGGYDDWFLPSRDELHLMYINLCKIGLGEFESGNYWSSSESEDSMDAYYNMFYSFGWYAKGARTNWNSFRVRAIRAF